MGQGYEVQGQPDFVEDDALAEEGLAIITPRTAEMLRQTKPWVRFLSVLGFIGSGFMVLGGGVALVGAIISHRPQLLAFALVYPPMGFLYFVPSFYLHRYASRIGSYLAQGRSAQLDAALEAQKSFWRFVGILTLVILCIYILILAGVVLAAIIRMA